MNETVGQVFKKLVNHQLLSLPVLDEYNRFNGFIDILDIVKFLTDHIVNMQTGGGSM
jgi:CBS-domain-containing membrane protein